MKSKQNKKIKLNDLISSCDQNAGQQKNIQNISKLELKMKRSRKKMPFTLLKTLMTQYKTETQPKPEH